MENPRQLAEPLALAVSECLRKQEVEVNEVVLTSYLLEVSPDPEILNRLELENQIDSLGNVGNVSITLARMEDDGCVAKEKGVEQLVVIGGKDKKKESTGASSAMRMFMNKDKLGQDEMETQLNTTHQNQVSWRLITISLDNNIAYVYVQILQIL